MQFSYNISEDFVKAVRIRCRRTIPITKTILSSISILICLLLVWGVISHDTQSQTTEESPHSSSRYPTWIPAIVIGVGLVVVLQVKYWGPRRVRELYRKNPAMQGQFTVDITPESIGMESTAEFTSRSKWNLYEFWREEDHLIVLVLLSGVFAILNTRNLTEPQGAELREILLSLIPRK